MFTGLIEIKGTVAHLQKHPGGARLTIRAPRIASALELGHSVAVNGCCVTVVEQDENDFTVDLVPETLARSNLGVLAIGTEVNLERAMAAGDRFGGHWVQGHVDCLATVRSRKRVGTEELLELTIPFEVSRFIVPQGSVTIDGVSLTVVDVTKDRVRVALIPHTRELTTLGKVEPMGVVNLELDVLAKYVDKHIAAYVARLPRMLREAGAAPNLNGEASHESAVDRSKLVKPKEPRSRAVTATSNPSRPSAEREPVKSAPIENTQTKTRTKAKTTLKPQTTSKSKAKIASTATAKRATSTTTKPFKATKKRTAAATKGATTKKGHR